MAILAKGAVAVLFDWEGNHRSGIAMAITDSVEYPFTGSVA